MNTVHISTSKSYNVLIDHGLLDNIQIHLADVVKKNCKIAIISDSNVWPIYGADITTKLQSSGYTIISYVFPAGEVSKTAETYLDILNFLAENHITRSDALLALGGGVTGDMTGFAAATFLRGIPYIQVPTSLLAMVDSSVGGKTAIDLPAGKNLVGAFYQPKLVLCDLDTLNTLPEGVFYDGCAEIIKYSVLYDEALYLHLSKTGTAFDRLTVVTRCIELKRNVVTEDEFDTGARQKLNLGHTIGHGVEAQSNFSVTHGQAVAIGMAVIAKAAAKLNYCSFSVPNSLIEVLTSFHLPVSTDYSAALLCNSALSDKKRSGATVNLIVPKAIGDCSIIPVPVEELETFIKEGL